MEVYFTIGISASGKSTWANQFEESRNLLFTRGKTTTPYTQINRDNIRKRVAVESGLISTEDDFSWDIWKWKLEDRVTEIQRALIDTAKALKHGIIISDTNLNFDRLVTMAKSFEDSGYTVHFVIMNTTFDIALKYDNARSNGVGAFVLRDQWAKFRAFMSKANESEWFKDRLALTSIPHFPKHTKSPDKRDIIMFDIDGTVSHMGDRRPFEWDRVSEDTPDDLLITLIGMYLRSPDHRVVFLSGRDGVCREDTLTWIETHIPNAQFTPDGNAELFMRAPNDTRKDTIVKQEMFFDHIEPRYNVVAVFDDRPSVVRMWHDIGLKVWACGDQLINF